MSEHIRYAVIESATSALVNVVIGSIAFGLAFHGKSRIPLWGAHGAALDLVPTIFMSTLMPALVPTWLARIRLRGGRVRGCDGTNPAWLPSQLLLRALCIALLLTLVVLPVVVGLFAWFGPDPWPYRNLFLTETLVVVLLAALATPMALRFALRDHPGIS